MYLALTAEQQAIQEAVRDVCRSRITAEQLAAWDRDPAGVDAGFWQTVCGLGWFGLALPEASGGSGRGLVEAAVLLYECGRGLVPRRVINAIRSGVAVATLAPGSDLLPALARGDRTLALALDEQSIRSPAHYATRVVAGDDGARVHGEKWYVAEAAQTDDHLVAAREGDGVSLVLVTAAAAADIRPLRSFDGERQAVVRYVAAPVWRRLTLAGAGADACAQLIRQQAALALAEMVGGMDAALERTVAYVKEREQFGQKLAVFQAVQHQVADMATAFTAARHLAWQAIARLASGSANTVDLAVAAAFVGQSCKRLTLAAHHLHGGAGYVVEHPLHYYSERAQSLCIRSAPEAAALEAIAAALLDE